jgi:aspartyl/asparaginyl-tRNA synthetase
MVASRLRTRLVSSSHQFFNPFYTYPPKIPGSDVEGAGELFKIIRKERGFFALGDRGASIDDLIQHHIVSFRWELVIYGH